MEIISVVISGLALFTWMLISAHMLNGVRQLRHLTELGKPQRDDSPLPRVSIVVTARNEERKAEQALRSLLSLDYPDYEIVYVNDRPDDRTGSSLSFRRTADGGDLRAPVATGLGREEQRRPATHAHRRKEAPPQAGRRSGQPHSLEILPRLNGH